MEEEVIALLLGPSGKRAYARQKKSVEVSPEPWAISLGSEVEFDLTAIKQAIEWEEWCAKYSGVKEILLNLKRELPKSCSCQK